MEKNGEIIMFKGKDFALAVVSGANNIVNQKTMIDELNVFPVPDGDTGTNMSMTIMSAKKEIEGAGDDVEVGNVSGKLASAMLRGARGNSGVILSILFRGISNSLKDKETATGKDLALALATGVDSAYKSVMKPTEGTMLTVARMASEKATELAKTVDNYKEIMDCIVEEAKRAVELTPDLLPVLKKAGVVDAGGMGLVLIFEGMKEVLCNGGFIQAKEKKTSVATETPTAMTAVAEFEGEITFTYCTEFIVEKSNKNQSTLKLRAYLEGLGDSVVLVEDDDIIKIHVHTNDPGKAIQAGISHGGLINIKIDNMRKQFEDKKKEAENAAANASASYVPVDVTVDFGFVAVCAGSGIQSLFTDFGVDRVVSGGQTMNPSTDDILNAIHSIGAKNIFVLPNNKNIIMAAEQAGKLADRNVCVLPTCSVPQGIAVMMSFDPTGEYKENRLTMVKAIDSVSTGQITFAARDSDFDGHNIKKGEILGIDNGKLAFTDRDIAKSVIKLAKSLVKKADSPSFVTIFYGIDVLEEDAEAIAETLKEKISSDVEINVIYGAQPVYYYIISVE